MSRFGWLYVLLGFFLVCGATVGAVSVALKPEPPLLPPISNSSDPASVEAHFGANPYNTIPASSLDLRDGTCWIYTNKVSWVVFECLGSVAKG